MNLKYNQIFFERLTIKIEKNMHCTHHLCIIPTLFSAAHITNTMCRRASTVPLNWTWTNHNLIISFFLLIWPSCCNSLNNFTNFSAERDKIFTACCQIFVRSHFMCQVTRHLVCPLISFYDDIWCVHHLFI